MIVFKSYFKIIKKYIPTIVMYTGIFLLFAVLSSIYNQNPSTTFSAVKPNIIIINNDQNGLLTDSFISYLKENANIEIKDKIDSKVEDALFFRKADYVMTIKENFSKDFMLGKNPKIITKKIPSSYSGAITEILLNNYLDIANLYVRSGVDEKTITTNIINDLNNKIEVDLINQSKVSDITKLSYYYNFANYTFLGIIILIVGIIYSSFNKEMVKKRNLASPMPLNNINRQITLGNLCFCILIWLLYLFFAIILYNKALFTINGLLMMLNSLLFVILALLIGTIIGNLVKNTEANNSIANLISLGSSFICGAFVPQELLGSGVLSFARVLPSYWYIKTNNELSNITSYSFSSLKNVYANIIILIAFIIIYYIILELIIRKKQRTI